MYVCFFCLFAITYFFFIYASVLFSPAYVPGPTLGILAWIEAFSPFHKSILLVTEDEETKAQAVARRIIGISISTLLQAVNS